jgi:hypothetical protein
MDTKKHPEQIMAKSDEDLVPVDDKGKGTSRRKFTRNALIGSAVLLTLSNRNAWGGVASGISTNLLMSADPNASIGTAQTTETTENYDNYNTVVPEPDPTTIFTYNTKKTRKKR